MRGFKTLLCTTALLASVFAVSGALAPSAGAQVVVGVQVPAVEVGIGIQPVCPYGYYGYAPYGCAPMGYYGPGYFYNGIFLGMGPWGGWGYSHGWGEHRFVGGGGGSYRGGGGWAADRRGGGTGYARGHAAGAARPGVARQGAVRSEAARPAARPEAARPSAQHAAPRAAAPHGAAPHAAAAHEAAPRGGGADHHK
jgi:hypothetical protein